MSGGGEISHTFEPDKFEVQDMRHLVVRQGERSDEIVSSADVDAIIVIAGSGKLHLAEREESLTAGSKVEIDRGVAYRVEATGDADMIVQIIGMRATG